MRTKFCPLDQQAVDISAAVLMPSLFLVKFTSVIVDILNLMHIALISLGLLSE